ncbi:Dynein assembly factor 3, axonemal [Exaiptasia diaphana]|nr:Dynein assembly factor 3, axonemal [Exaiptasia diaphana]
METKEKLGLQEKTELFLELFGNSLIRPQTSEYLQTKANEFIRMVTDFEYVKTQLPCIDMSQLKFKERDMLEGIFKFWRNTDPKLFDICNAWESRLRQYLGVRYDSRENIFDWDLVMKLQKMASIVNSHEYKGWREHGVAFELRQDSTYEVSNRTLASGLLLKKGDQRVPCRGYWGDVINSPYISFGIESEEEKLFKKNNDQHIKMATNVAEFNITALIHELTTGEKYKPPENIKDNKRKTNQATITEIIEEEEEEEEKSADDKVPHNKLQSKNTEGKEIQKNQ